MAGRHLKELFAAHRDGDELTFRRAANAIIEEEEAKRHTALARDLRNLLAGGGASFVIEAPLPDAPRDRDSGSPLMAVATPKLVGLDDLVLAPEVRVRLEVVLRETARWPALDQAGIPRRNRILLHGPPGNGKSSIAAALAAELNWPLASVRIDGLVSSLLGETASNLREVFEFSSANPTVTLLDEFDSLGKYRGDASDHGELRRVVNATLQMIDSYCGKSLLVAATNTPEVLDSALWRRFDEVIEIPTPTVLQATKLLARLLGPTAPDCASQVGEALGGLPFAAIEFVAFAARRKALLADRPSPSEQDLRDAVEDALRRPWA
ncbi:MAG: ATP-binding protein [Promicromonosporaceae bacterium]|nr:ATP-binding protein [Promicromonosporaceae bacterium]